MNFLSHMRISHKISSLMVGLVLGFIAIGVTYYLQINVDTRIRATEQNAFQFQLRVTELNSKQLQAQSLASQYLATGDESLLDRTNERFGEFRDDLAAIQAQSASYQGSEYLARITTLMEEYESAFQSAAVALRGAESASQNGAQVTLAEQAEALESMLPAEGSEQLRGHVTRMRRVAGDFLATANVEYLNDFKFEVSQFRDLLANSPFAADEQRRIQATIDQYETSFEQFADGLTTTRALNETLAALEARIAQAFIDVFNATDTATQTILADSAGQKKAIQALVTAIIFMVAMGTAVGIYLIYKSIVFPMVHIQSVIGRINKGNSHSRVKLKTDDELGDLGKAFNKLFDERIQQLEDQSLENERLNNSIISLIKSLGMIAKKDLTIKVPVSSDITGTVSDAVNLLTTETAKTLYQVKDISEQVNDVSNQLQEQSSQVIEFADNEKKQILAAAKALDILARAMNEVARRAESTSETAGEAIQSTQSARQSVEETVNGIRTIRETIAETEKRTKRLGDRSQEISGIVSLINTIAERTHILALNASMHAASAGEAGKGFAVVADEVQRLAESARQSTDDIAAMVNNMRVETADTVNIMNTLISQVAEGSRLAEQAGHRMTTTETATQRLVEDVKYIAEQAVQQADIATRVRDRSAIIRSFTEKTGQQLEEQKQQTDRLMRCAETLVERISVFTLPKELEPARLVFDGSASEPVSEHTLRPLHAAG